MADAFGLDPGAAALDFDNALDQGQADAGAVDLYAEPLEQTEDAVAWTRVVWTMDVGKIPGLGAVPWWVSNQRPFQACSRVAKSRLINGLG